MAVNRRKMLSTLDNFIAKSGTATWAQISEAVKADGHTVTNWLSEVRGPLQELINDGAIQRVGEVTGPEMYQAV